MDGSNGTIVLLGERPWSSQGAQLSNHGCFLNCLLRRMEIVNWFAELDVRVWARAELLGTL